MTDEKKSDTEKHGVEPLSLQCLADVCQFESNVKADSPDSPTFTPKQLEQM